MTTPFRLPDDLPDPALARGLKPGRSSPFLPPDLEPPELRPPPPQGVPAPAQPAISPTDALEYRRLLLEQTRRKGESLKLYEPLPIQAAFHACGSRQRLLRGSNRAGKAQPVDEPVLTPFGWAAIGSLEEGDLVIGGDGKPCRVTGVFPQGRKPVFHVSFDDGSWTRCCDEHLWKIKVGAARFGVRRNTDDGWVVRSLGEIRSMCGSSPVGGRKPATPNAVAKLPARTVPLDPYLLGVLLGDGTFAHGVVGLSSADQEIVDAVAAGLPPEVSLKKVSKYDYRISGDGSRNPITDVLAWYGLKSKLSHEKHIPDDYLFNSAAVRLAVLQGLCDTDGSWSTRGAKQRGGYVEFSTTSPALAEGVQFLVRSLGGKATLSWRRTSYTHGGVKKLGRRSARLYIRLPGMNPFRIKRKADNYVASDRHTPHRLMSRIVEDGDAECVCIAVDSPDHTYITRNCIVTHNTLAPAIEVARAVTGQDPHDKYPFRDGRVYAVGRDEKHVGEVMYRKLFRSGAFRMIRDLATREWRAYRPWEPADFARKRESKPAPPLVPQRFVKSISWKSKSANVPEKVVLTTGWEIDFFSSLGKPPRGSDLDVVWFDEEIVDGDWHPEMMARLLDRAGCLVWGATPQTGTDRLLELHFRCEREYMAWLEAGQRPADEPEAREFVVLLADNPHIGEAEKRELAASLDDADHAVRIGGEFAVQAAKIYPEYGNVHRLDYFDIPHDWTRYAVIDPGRQVCAVLFAAVPPPDADMPHPIGRVGEHNYVVLYDELYIQNCSAAIFGERMGERCRGQQFEAFLIDSHGSRNTEMGSGKTVEKQYSDALAENGVECVRTGHGFTWASDDVIGGIEAVRSLFRVRARPGFPTLFVVDGHNRLPNFEHEISRYRYKREQGRPTEKPEDKGRVHLMACTRYLAMYAPKYVEPRKTTRLGGAYKAFLETLRKKKGQSGATKFGPRRPT